MQAGVSLSAMDIAIALALHILSAVIWVGGMFLLHQCLRPNIGALEPAQRFPLMRGTLGKFFPWVWGAVILLPLTGYWIIHAVYGGFANAGVHIHIMHGIGWIMFLLFAHLFFAPWRRMKQAVEAEDWSEAGKRLGQIRMIVTVNLILGLVTVAVAGGGRYLPV